MSVNVQIPTPLRRFTADLGEVAVEGTTVGEAIARGGLEDYSLVLLSLGDTDDLERVDGLLWSCSTARRR